MAGGVGELLCLGRLLCLGQPLCLGRLVTGLASGAPLPPGTHSSLLEFDTWRLALSSHLGPNKVFLGANNWLENMHKLLCIKGLIVFHHCWWG